MSAKYFHIKEHTLPSSHIRSYPYATLNNDDEEPLQLAIKQYTPVDNPKPRRGDVTIIGAHANGFPKELYEALWDDLHQQSKKQGWRIRSIYIADVWFQGWSGVLNEDKLGNEPGWYDHPRDLLHMVNTFRMPRPIIGIGHSMGGNNLINLSLMHPRLLETLILIDPVIVPLRPDGQPDPGLAAASSIRRDRWPSRKVAKESFLKSKFYQAWDSRVLDAWIDNGLRDLPTKLYPDPQPKPALTGSVVTLEPTIVPNVVANDEDKEVTLTTTKHQEVFSFYRTYHEAGLGDPPEHRLHPERSIYQPPSTPSPFYRPEPHITFNMLPYLRPSVMYVFGEHSDMSTEQQRKLKMETTGTAGAGSGGAKVGKVTEVVLKETGHLIAMEKPEETASHAASWIGGQIKQYETDEAALKKYWDALPEKEKWTLGPEYTKGFEPFLPKRKAKPSGSKL